MIETAGGLSMAQTRGTVDAEGRTAVQRFSYQLFIGCVSFNALLVLIAYYLLPLPRPVREVLAIVDTLNAVILLVDFLAQLVTSANKVGYFVFLGGWLDLLGSLPLHPLLRLLRIGRSIRSWRRLARATPVEIRLAARRRLAESGLFMVATLVLLVVTAGSIALAAIEPRVTGANIRTGSDAVWFVLTTVATVGYGDTYPVTDAGRMMAVLLMVVGISAFSVLTSSIASAFISQRRAGRDDGNA
jgi:voltage-gated potassium channel